MKSEFLLVARKILESERRAMRPKDIVDMAFERGLFSKNIAGRTPHQTMKAKLSVHVRRQGERSLFIRMGPGRFYLRHLLEDSDQPYSAPPLLPPKASERVLVFPTAKLDPLMGFQGITLRWKPLFDELKNLPYQYQPRLKVEEDPAFTQILTYVMVARHGHLLTFRRGTYNRVESFLRGSYCVGFGGHVTEADLSLFNSADLGIWDSAARELSEELILPEEDARRLEQRKGLSIVGVLNDDSSAVGRRHLALVMRYEVSEDKKWTRPERGEKSITQLRWLPPDLASRALLWNFEYWSQLCLREFAPRLVRTHPAYRLIHKASLKPPHLLCVIGLVGSGKSEATRILVQDFGYREINSGTVMAELLGLPPIPQTPREEFQGRAAAFVETSGGPKQLADAIWERAREIAGPRILIDGIRHGATLKALRTLAAGLRVGVIFVQTSPDVAFEFYRERSGAGCSIGDYLRVREGPGELEVSNLITAADAVLYNWTGKVEYRGAIHGLMRELGITQ